MPEYGFSLTRIFFDSVLKYRKLWVRENPYSDIFYAVHINPLSANPTKWSNKLKRFVGKSRQIV